MGARHSWVFNLNITHFVHQGKPEKSKEFIAAEETQRFASPFLTFIRFTFLSFPFPSFALYLPFSPFLIFRLEYILCPLSGYALVAKIYGGCRRPSFLARWMSGREVCASLCLLVPPTLFR